MSQLIRCLLGFHKWLKWATTSRGEIIAVPNHNPVGTFEVQRRECALCGKSEIRNQRTFMMYST